MSLKIVSFGTTTIQRLRRIALDANLLETLGLKEGDVVQVALDVDSPAIVIRKSESPPQARATGGKRVK